jgi:hypothetical protein
VHHCEGLFEAIETDILLAIFRVQNKKISIRDQACTRRFQRTREDTGPKMGLNGHYVGRPAPPTPPRVPSTSNWSQFIQQWSREVTRIDDVAVTWPLLHLGLYKDAPTPSRRSSLIQIKAQHQRIRARLSNEKIIGTTSSVTWALWPIPIPILPRGISMFTQPRKRMRVTNAQRLSR